MRKILLFIALAIASLANAQNKRPAYCEVMAYNFWGVGKEKNDSTCIEENECRRHRRI